MKCLAIGVVLAACSSSSAPAPTGSGGSPFETFDTTAPKLGDLAPDFTLTDASGTPLKLSDATARGPVVLVWGSFT